MQRHLIFLCVIFLVPSTYQTDAPTGSVNLDEFSFDKIISKFDAALVKFDVAFPYGDKHDAYVALARDATDVNELLVAEVGVKDYGAKENEALAKKYGAVKDVFPVVKLFVKGKSEPVTFDESKGFTTDDLRRFVRENTGIYLSLPGCVKELDVLVSKFMKSKKDDKQNILKETKEAQEKLASKNATSGKVYKAIMEKIIEKGEEFLDSEYNRVNKLLSGKISNEKKKELSNRVNIIQTFQLYVKKDKRKEEL